MSSSRGRDPLQGMYFLAALMMALGFLLVLILMFLPPDLFSRSDRGDLWVPGSGDRYETPASADGAVESPEEQRLQEELHMH